jgi:type I restriction enzyme S subunit
MQESELGLIPVGWRVGRIKDFTKRIQYGFTQSASNEKVGPRFLRITDIQNGYIDWANVPYCVIDKKDWEKYKIENYDIFIARTGASTGENTLVIDPPEAVFASYLIRIQFRETELALYVGKLLRSRGYFDFIDSIKSGSAQPNANAQQLTDFVLVLPPANLLKNYSEIVEQIEQLKAEYQNQSATLAQIRDNLLPKLMSGEIVA